MRNPHTPTPTPTPAQWQDRILAGHHAAAARATAAAAAANAAVPTDTPAPDDGYETAGAGVNPFRQPQPQPQPQPEPRRNRKVAGWHWHQGSPSQSRPGYQPLPPAVAVAERLGFRKVGAQWRGPHLCGGEALGSRIPPNAGYALYDGWDGAARVWCHYGCDTRDAYRALRDALPESLSAGTGYQPPPPAPVDWDTGAGAGAGVNRNEVAQAAAANRWRKERPPAGYELIPGTGWPALDGSDDAPTGKQQIAAIPGGWTAWADYQLADGLPDTAFRDYPGRPDGPKTLWATKPQGAARRPHNGLQPLRFPHRNDADGAAAVALILEGEQDACLMAAAAPPGVAVYSANSASIMAGISIDGLLQRHSKFIIWPDNDAPRKAGVLGVGPQAAARLAGRLAMQGASVNLVSLAAVESEAQALNIPESDWDGIGAADLTPAACIWLVADTLSGKAPAPQPDTVILEMPAQTGAHACNWRLVMRRQDVNGTEGQCYLACGKCLRCMAYKRENDRLRYRIGFQLLAGNSDQTIITLPYDTPDDARRFRSAQHARVRRAMGPGVANVGVCAASVIGTQALQSGVLTMIYLTPLPDDVIMLIKAACYRAGNGGRVETRRVTPTEFAELVPDTRRQHTHGADTDDADDAPAPALLSVKFNNWPAKFEPPAPDYGLSDGFIDRDAPPPPADDPSPLTPLLRDRLETLGLENTALVNAYDWLAAVTQPLPPDACQIVADGPDADDAARDAAWAAIRGAGYQGPRGLIADAVRGGLRDCHIYVRSRIAGAPLDPEIDALAKALAAASPRQRTAVAGAGAGADAPAPAPTPAPAPAPAPQQQDVPPDTPAPELPMTGCPCAPNDTHPCLYHAANGWLVASEAI